MKKINILLLILILFSAFFIRIVNIDKIIIFDEYIQTKAGMEHSSVGLDKVTGITPLTNWTRIAFTFLFGFGTIQLKIISIIFGLLSIILIYFLSKELYDDKTAIWACILLSISAWHILGTTSISFDGAFLTFYYLLTIFCFIKYMKLQKKFWLLLTGISFGLAMLTKLNAILIVPILITYYLLSKKIEMHTFFIDFGIIGISGFIIFSIFPISAYLTDWYYFIVVMQHTTVFHSESFSLPLLLIQYALAMIWIGPLYLGLYLIKLIRFEKEDVLLHIWITIILLFFTFIIQDNFRPVERYFLVILPPICILGGNYISKFKFNKKDIILYLFTFLIFLTLLFSINISQNETLPFYPKTEFINHVVNIDWNFLVPFTGDQGPIGMYLSFNSIAISFIASGIFLVLLLLCRKKAFAKTVFLIFLAVSTAFNAVMLEEMVFNTTHINVDKVTKESIKYALNNNLQAPLFVFRNYALKYYLSPKYGNITQIDFKDEYNLQMIKHIQEGGTVIVIDFPKMNRESNLWNALTSCKKIKDFEDKSQKIGFIFEC